MSTWHSVPCVRACALRNAREAQKLHTTSASLFPSCRCCCCCSTTSLGPPLWLCCCFCSLHFVSMALVHRCRFFEWVPEQILCLATNAANLLAVGRINGDIDIWNPLKDKYYSGKKITGQEGQSLRCLTWGKGDGAHRLFSGSDLGFITEWNLKTLQQGSSTDSYGGWVAALSVNASGTRLAAGTASCISIFDISDGKLSSLFASSSNQIRIYGITNNRFAEIGAIRLDSNIFSLLVLPNSTVVVGTEKGEVQMWNGKLKVRIATFSEHQTTVAALAASANGDTVYASGGDPKICMFKFISQGNGSGEKWIYANHQRRHTHDVSSLVVIGDHVISGSSDTMIIFYQQDAFHANSFTHGIKKLLPYPHSPSISIAQTARLVLYRKCDGLELWRLGSPVNPASSEHILPMGIAPVKLLDMELKKERYYLRTSSISPNGKYIACATVNSVKVFSLDYSEDTVAVKPLNLPLLINPHKLVLTDTTLVLANQEQLQILDLATLTDPADLTFGADEESFKEAPINTLVASDDGTFVAVGNLNNNIMIANIQKKLLMATLPKMPRQHTAIGFQPGSQVVAVVDVTGKFFMYDFKLKTFTPWSRQLPNQLPANYALCVANDPVVGISFDPANSSIMLLWASKFLAAVKVEDASVPAAKKAKTATTSMHTQINIIGQYSDMMCVGFVKEDLTAHKSGLVVVERPWLEIIPHLPNVFDLKLFGR